MGMRESFTSSLDFVAPLSGFLMPMESVPDPVFSQKMVGDGVSIDPISQCLVAPCAGEVIQLHTAGHAITIATPAGVQVLIHIGLDTVSLKGKGFQPKTKLGAQVRAGDPLIEFDADFVATQARSLLTQMVVLNHDRAFQLDARSGSVTAGKDIVLSLKFQKEGEISAADSSSAAAAAACSDRVLIQNPTGLHARPAAVLANAAKKFKSEILLQRGEKQANAKSVVALLGLEVNHGEQVRIIAKGADAQEALSALVLLLKEGLGETAHSSAVPNQTAQTAAKKAESLPPGHFHGVSASPGSAIGKTFKLLAERFEIVEHAQGIEAEQRKLDQAIREAGMQLQELQAQFSAKADSSQAQIFSAHQELLEDPELLSTTARGVAAGKSAAYAWKQAFTLHADQLSSLRNELLAGRANDLRDVGRRVLRLLAGVEPEAREIPVGSILIAEDLTPSDVGRLDRTKVVGICTVTGGATSHVAILARSLGIPAIAGIDARVLEVADGELSVMDGSLGTLRLNPNATELAQAEEARKKEATQRQHDLESAFAPATTADGHRVEIAANIADLEDAERAVATGAEGIGLLRSEFLFLERESAPSEEEQMLSYEKIAHALGAEKPLVIRTLDVGGDKPLSYLPIPKEENPFLGQRGIRIGLDRPEILRTQLRAILKSAHAGKIHIMFPMIATLDELRAAKAILEDERIRLGVPPIPVGIMVEVPSAAILAEQFAREADFFSIGTNDLTQYTLAMDRGHPKLAAQVDGLDPSILHLIARTVEAAHRHGRWVGVCGGIAGDEAAVPILVGLGVDELSVSIPVIPAVKARIREMTMAGCRKLAQEALKQETAAQVRALSAQAKKETR